MSRRIVMRMFSHVGSELRVGDSTERHKPECEPADCDMSNATSHAFLP